MGNFVKAGNKNCGMNGNVNIQGDKKRTFRFENRFHAKAKSQGEKYYDCEEIVFDWDLYFSNEPAFEKKIELFSRGK